MKAKDYISKFKEEKQREYSKNTVSAYILDIKQFLGFIKKDFEEISLGDIEDFKISFTELKYKPKTINRKLTSVRSFIEYLNNQEDFETKIFVKFKLIKVQKQEYLEETLTKNDFDRLIRAAEKENDKTALALFNGLFYTGARISEILQLKVGDINNDFVSVCGKGKKYRDLFIADELKEILRDYVKNREGDDDTFLYLNCLGKLMSRQTAHSLIKKYAGLSKVKLERAHAHGFRHLFCFRLLEAGEPLETVADLAGHTDINTTKIYTRKTKAELMKTINNLKNKPNK
jgi:integrase/recombinase XerD